MHIDALMVVQSFAKAARRDDNFGKIVFQNGSGQLTALNDHRRDWNMPAFDFGALDDQASGNPQALTDKEYEYLVLQGRDLMEKGLFRLPFERCFYISSLENGRRGGLMFLTYLVQSEVSVGGVIFSYEPLATTKYGRWVPHAGSFRITGGETEFFPIRDESDLLEETEAYCLQSIAFTVLLSVCSQQTANKSSRITRINKDRHKAGVRKLAPMIDVRLDRPALTAQQVAREAAASAVKQPHDRRGHYRLLKSGRTIPVRASKINGGSDTRRAYKLVHGPRSATQE